MLVLKQPRVTRPTLWMAIQYYHITVAPLTFQRYFSRSDWTVNQNDFSVQLFERSRAKKVSPL